MLILESLARDLRHGARMLRKNPGLTAAAILTLALSSGANTAVFSVFNSILLKPLPVPRPDRLVSFERMQNGRSYGPDFSLPFAERMHSLSGVFAETTAVWLIERTHVTIHDDSGGPESSPLKVGLVSGSYFSTFGVGPAFGRVFTTNDDRKPGGHPIAVLSYRYWERRFGRSTSAIGRTFDLSQLNYTIIGVAAQGFDGDEVGQNVDVWIPVAMQSEVMPEFPDRLTTTGSFVARIVARLNDGADARQAEAQAQATYIQYLRENAGASPTPQMAGRIEREHLIVNSDRTGFAPQREYFKTPLMILMIAAGFVLLIACANIANLLLAHCASRQREFSIRLAVGAGRFQIARQLLTESALLAVLGGLCGIPLAALGTRYLANFMTSGLVRFSVNADPDSRVFVFTIGICLLASVLIGLAPSLQATKTPLRSSLSQQGGGSGETWRKFGAGKLLVVAQVAISLVLLIGAGLFIRTVHNLKSQDMGFRRDHLLMVWIEPQYGNLKGQSLADFYAEAEERIASLPGVVSAAASSHGMLSGFVGMRRVSVEGYTPSPGEDMLVQWTQVAPGFFQTIGMQRVIGRDFTNRDIAGLTRVAIINESMARRFFGSESPMGKRFGISYEAGYPVEIVGMVKDSKYESLRDRNVNMMYLPFRQDVDRLFHMCVAVRIAGEPGGLPALIRRELRRLNSNVVAPKIDTIEEQLGSTMVEERLLSVLSSSFGILALLLSCVGLYGMVSFMAKRRTKEVGIRIALGATRGDIVGMVMRESILLVVAGIAIGIPTALATTRLITSWMYGVKGTDGPTITAVCVTLLVVAVASSLPPAFRAATADPVRALRYE